MKRAKKTYGSCVNTFQSLKYLTQSKFQHTRSSDSEDLISHCFQIQDSKHEKVPWKAIALAVFLAIGGMVQLTAGVLIFTGHIGKEYEDRFWPFLILGVIMFLPGAYHLFVAFAAYKNIPGYSFSSIPDFD
ncbi:transmembrane protein 230 [Diaphorina citri]|uniref:Transmembrane protein 230 n=1 Tax=Diaphorina citri TaxID=121845 RepID=A0A1S3DJ97_DIACI|nr:transmembrane protein 230-like [Diaphorina citri]XP_008485027.1 transmembrane protein 230 [Diaphorina citri]